MKLIPYLLFDGNAEEVLDVYAKIFSGTIHDVSRFGEGDFPMPEEQKSKIMHARLTFGENLLMMSDARPGSEINHGDGINLSIGLDDDAQARSIFDQLAEGGNVEMPMEKQFWGALYGQVKDRFGINWMINSEAK